MKKYSMVLLLVFVLLIGGVITAIKVIEENARLHQVAMSCIDGDNFKLVVPETIFREEARVKSLKVEWPYFIKNNPYKEYKVDS